MMRKTILAGVLLLAAAPLALAQPAPPPPGGPGAGPERGPQAEERGDRERGNRDERRERDRERGERGERGRDRGPDRAHGERRGPPPGREAGAGFRIDLGPDGSLEVRCGSEELRSCVEAARPLIDVVSDRAGPAGEPRPAPGLAPLPPSDAETLDVPLPDDVSADEPPVLPEGLSGDGEEAPASAN